MFCARVCTQVAVSQLQDALNDMGVDSTGEGGAGRPRTGKPRQPVANLGGRKGQADLCESPWKHSADSSHCSEGPCSAGACEYLRKYCGRQGGGMFNYLSLPYCSMGFAPWLGSLTLLLWAALLVLWLSAVAEFFLCPAVSVLTRLCGMSEQVCVCLSLSLSLSLCARIHPSVNQSIHACMHADLRAYMRYGHTYNARNTRQVLSRRKGDHVACVCVCACVCMGVCMHACTYGMHACMHARPGGRRDAAGRGQRCWGRCRRRGLCRGLA